MTIVVITAYIPILSSLSLSQTNTYTHTLAFFPGIKTSHLSSLGRPGQNVILTLAWFSRSCKDRKVRHRGGRWELRQKAGERRSRRKPALLRAFIFKLQTSYTSVTLVVWEAWCPRAKSTNRPWVSREVPGYLGTWFCISLSTTWIQTVTGKYKHICSEAGVTLSPAVKLGFSTKGSPPHICPVLEKRWGGSPGRPWLAGFLSPNPLPSTDFLDLATPLATSDELVYSSFAPTLERSWAWVILELDFEGYMILAWTDRQRYIRQKAQSVQSRGSRTSFMRKNGANL